MNAPVSAPQETATDATAVEAVRVSKIFTGETEVRALDDVSVAIRPNEFFTLLGPSGCGKTTLLRVIAGFEPPTMGMLKLGGRDISRLPPNRRPVNTVFQNYALFPHMTVRENLAFPLRMHRFAKAEIPERVAKALEIVQLGHLADRKPAQLSGGQQQRVALARALVFEPTLVLMDEPLGALDKQLREQMQYEIKHIHENLGVTVVYVTHDQSEALTMSDRVAVFNDGVIQQISTPDELYERPQNSFVAQFIGENNKLSGQVREISGEECRVDLDGGGSVTALPVNVEGVGARTTLSLRPERIEIDPPADWTNSLDGRVEELIYLGDHIRARLSVAGNDAFIVKVPNREGSVRLKEGTDTRVGWLARDCRALDPLQNA